jgi:hypothetical protein
LARRNCGFCWISHKLADCGGHRPDENWAGKSG